MHIQRQDYINIEAPAEARGGEAARDAREGRGAEVRWRTTRSTDLAAGGGGGAYCLATRYRVLGVAAQVSAKI